jgi:hypothetical protein
MVAFPPLPLLDAAERMAAVLRTVAAQNTSGDGSLMPRDQNHPCTETTTVLAALAAYDRARLEARRTTLSLTPEALATRAGLPTTEVACLLAAQRKPTAWDLARLTHALHLSFFEPLRTGPLPVAPVVR